MHKKRKKLLRHANGNSGRLKMSYVFKVYGNREQGKSAVESLESEGFLSRTSIPGVFQLVELPEEMENDEAQTKVSELE